MPWQQSTSKLNQILKLCTREGENESVLSLIVYCKDKELLFWSANTQTSSTVFIPWTVGTLVFYQPQNKPHLIVIIYVLCSCSIYELTALRAHWYFRNEALQKLPNCEDFHSVPSISGIWTTCFHLTSLTPYLATGRAKQDSWLALIHKQSDLVKLYLELSDL